MNTDAKLQKSLKKIAASNVGSKIKIRAKKTATQGHSIYLDHFSNGKRRYEFLSLYLTGDQNHDGEAILHAIEIRKIRETEILSLRTGASIGTWKRRSSVAEYIIHQGKKKSRQWGCVAAKLEEFRPNLKFSELTPDIIEDWKEFLLAHLKRNTAWGYLATLKSAINMARKEGILVLNPASDISIPKQEAEKTFLYKEEIELLKATPCHLPELKRAYLFACYSGLRISDVKRLEWKNIDYNANQITLRMKKTDEMLYIPLLSDAKTILGSYATGKVFDLPADATMNRDLKKWASEAKLDKRISFHSARHTFAIAAIEAGIEINVIQKLLGHRELSSTLTYAKVKSRVVDQAADRLNTFFER